MGNCMMMVQSTAVIAVWRPSSSKTHQATFVGLLLHFVRMMSRQLTLCSRRLFSGIMVEEHSAN